MILIFFLTICTEAHARIELLVNRIECIVVLFIVNVLPFLSCLIFSLSIFIVVFCFFLRYKLHRNVRETIAENIVVSHIFLP